MSRWFGLFNLAQAGVMFALATYFQERWPPAIWMAWACGGLQLAGGLLLLGTRKVLLARWASVAVLLYAALLAGLHVQAGVHIVNTFTPIGGKQGYALLGAVAAALPWVTFFPIWQLVASRPKAIEGATATVAMLLAVLIPAGMAMGHNTPTRTWQPVDGATAATWLFQSWMGTAQAAAPDSDGPVMLVASAVQGGKLVETQSVEGDSLAQALGKVSFQATPGENAGVYLDVATAEGRLWLPALMTTGVAMVRPAEQGLRQKDRVIGTLETRTRSSVSSRSVAEGVSVPTLRLKSLSAGRASHWVDMDSWLASSAGTAAMAKTWTAPPQMTAQAALDAALEGARHIARNQSAAGKYAYVIKGPEGTTKGGYNYPRHAGGTWFMARVATRTGDEEVRQAAIRGLQYMVDHTVDIGDGRAYVYDPARRDGKAWVGTTGLGLLAFTELGEFPEMTAKYAAWVASSVDDKGSVRGDMDVASNTWPEQDEVTYAQGQGLLALAASERAGVPGVSEALDRAISYVEGDYWPMPAATFKTLDEHWMCLAAAAVHEVRGVAAGETVCKAYLADVALLAPVPGSAIQPPAGPAAGLAEAVIAQAELDRRAGRDDIYRQRALNYGELMLSNLYRPTDAPLLGRPDRLMGGFRDHPWSLDVRVDAVQHIGCALLGVEQLLRDEVLPGAMP